MKRTVGIVAAVFVTAICGTASATLPSPWPVNASTTPWNCNDATQCLMVNNTNSASATPTGLYGSAPAGKGTRGDTDTGIGVFGYANLSGDGVQGMANGAGAGVNGIANNSGTGVKAYSAHGDAIFSTAADANRAAFSGNNTGGGWTIWAGTGVYSQTGFWSGSDIRLKKDVGPSAYGLAALMQLRPVSFRWRDAARGTGVQTGFIAQDVRQVIPDAVAVDPASGTLAVNYQAVIPMLVRAVQELDARCGK